MKAAIFLAVLLAASAICAVATKRIASAADDAEKKFFKIWPIGKVRKQDKAAWIEIDPQYKDALLGLNQWSHIHVFYWFDRNDTPQKRAILQVHPRGNEKNPLTGVFATRSPFRPNLIAMSTCKILTVEDCIIRIDSIDALDNSPVIDIKPYTPGPERILHAKVPDWAGPR